jgi:uncharacterized protein YkwD
MGTSELRWPSVAIAVLIAGCGVGTIEGPPGSSDDDADDPPGDVDARGSGADARAERPDAPGADDDEPDARGPADAAADDEPADAAAGSPDARADARPAPIDARPPAPDAAGGIDCRNAASWPADWVAFEDAVLVLVNQHRAAGARCGTTQKPAVGPVRMDAALRQAARCHSLDMAVNGYFSHDSQDGRSPWDRIDDAGYTAGATGENIAAGQRDAAAAMQSWITSEGHCNNIMASGSNETGIGYAFQPGSPYGAYWTETFGRR